MRVQIYPLPFGVRKAETDNIKLESLYTPAWTNNNFNIFWAPIMLPTSGTSESSCLNKLLKQPPTPCFANNSVADSLAR